MGERQDGHDARGGAPTAERDPSPAAGAADAQAFEWTRVAHEATPVATAIWSVDGRLLHANPVFCDVKARPLGELLGEALVTFVAPADAPAVVAALADVAAGRRATSSCRMIGRDATGDPVELVAQLHPVFGVNGRPSHVVSQIFRFADGLDAADDPQGLEARGAGDAVAPLVDHAPALVWHADETGRPLVGNRATTRFLGLPEDSTGLADGFADALHPEDEELRALHRSRIARRAPFELTARARRADGEWRWLLHRAEPLFTPRGELRGYVGVSADVTDLQDRVAHLEATAHLFEIVAEAGPLAVLRLDATGRIVYANARWAELVNDAETRLSGHGWTGMLVREHVQEVIRRAEASARTGEPFMLRVRAHDASIAPSRATPADEGRYWAELRVAPVHLDDGTHDGFVATIADVSAEVAAAERADRLARVLDEGTDYLLMVDPSGALSYVNGAAEEGLGLSVGPEVEPVFLLDILEPDSFTFFHEVVQPVLVETQRWRGELTILDAQGRPVPVSALVLAEHNDQHRIETTTVVARDISDLKQAQWRMRQLATHDYLTGLPNRVLLYERLDHALARFHRFDQRVALLYLDLDRFKPINDELGHHVGDAVLVKLSDRIHSTVRETDTAARIGGDEFAVLVEGYDSIELLQGVAERLIAAISDPIGVEGVTVQVGCSIGIVSADETTKDADSLLARADAAMYEAKAAGRGRYVIATP